MHDCEIVHVILLGTLVNYWYTLSLVQILFTGTHQLTSSQAWVCRARVDLESDCAGSNHPCVFAFQMART